MEILNIFVKGRKSQSVELTLIPGIQSAGIRGSGYEPTYHTYITSSLDSALLYTKQLNILTILWKIRDGAPKILEKIWEMVEIDCYRA